MIKYFMHVFIVVICLNVCFAQESFNTCTGLYLNKTLMTEDYSPRSKATLKLTDSGKLTVNEVTIESADDIKAGKAIPFRIAIKDKRTQTIFLFSQKTHTSVDVEKILARCHSGDQLLILSTDDAYSVLPSEILIE